jgi:hypothetical protein
MHGRIYVADACLGQVFVFDRDGEFLRFLLGRTYQAVVEQPTALAISDDLGSSTLPILPGTELSC